MSRGRSIFAGALFFALALAPLDVLGQGASAKESYEAATAAFAAKHYAEAAVGFARADALEPNPIALESALKAAVLADDPVLGMELVTRAESRPADARVDPVKKRARAAFEKRVGRIELRCPDAAACFAKVDPGGRALEPGHPIWVPVGDVLVTLSSDAGRGAQTINVSADALVVVQAPASSAPAPTASAAPPPTAPATTAPASASPALVPSASAAPAPSMSPAPPVPVDASKGGLSPVWFVVSAVATGGLTAGTIASGVDTLGLHDDYLAGDDAAKESGQSAQLRTNVLLGVTLAAATATTIFAVFTDWGGAAVAVGPGTARVGLRF